MTSGSACPLWKWFRILMLWALAGGCVTLASPARAALSCSFTATGPTAIDFGTVIAARNAPIGSVIGTASPSGVHVDCPINDSPTANKGFYLQYETNLITSTATNTWNTGVPGIGLRVVSVNFGNRILPSAISSVPPQGGPNWGPFAPDITTAVHFVGDFQFTFQLIKTADQVSSGTFNVGQIMNLVSHDIPNNNTSHAAADTLPFTLGGAVNVPTCSTSNVVVDLPEVSPAAFAAIGALAGTRPFSISLLCDAGDPVKVLMTLSDGSPGATNDGSSNNLGLTSVAGSATGVKIRIRKSDGTDVYYGPDSFVTGNSGQFQVGTMTGSAGGSTITADFTASYVSTAATVTGGPVNAIATFTMSYQ